MLRFACSERAQTRERESEQERREDLAPERCAPVQRLALAARDGGAVLRRPEKDGADDPRLEATPKEVQADHDRYGREGEQSKGIEEQGR